MNLNDFSFNAELGWGIGKFEQLDLRSFAYGIKFLEEIKHEGNYGLACRGTWSPHEIFQGNWEKIYLKIFVF